MTHNAFTLLLLLSVHAVYPLGSQYKPLDFYGQMLFQLIYNYVNDHATSNPQNVVTFVNSDETKTAFGDAKTAGYSRKEVVFATYQFAFAKDNEVIIMGLRDVLAQEQVRYDAAFYGSYVTMGITGVTLLGITRFLWRYLRTDKKAIDYYMANHHLYVRSGGTGTGTLSTTTPLLIPEPSF
jgi:hypothetical protein